VQACQQLHGGMGYMRGTAIERLWRDARVLAIGGGAEFNGVVYAPNGNVKIHGNADVKGSIVANNITVVGNSKFHYDEALANWGGNNPYGIVKWLELTSESQRTTAFAGW